MPKPRKLDVDLVVGVLAELLKQKFRAECEVRKTFPWLKADGRSVLATAYFHPPLNCLFEFDPPDRFTPDRGCSLKKYPQDVPLGFDFSLYTELCETTRIKSTVRTRRRAGEDRALDLLPPKHGLNPTLRLAEVEILGKIDGNSTEKKLRTALEVLLEKRLSLHGGTTFLQLLDHPSGKPFTPRIGL